MIHQLLKILSSFTLIFILQSTSSSAQNLYFSIGANVLLPGDNVFMPKLNSTTGIGGSGRLEFGSRNKIAGIASLAHATYQDRDLLFSGTPPTVMSGSVSSILAGIKYYPLRKNFVPKGLFFTGEAGVIRTVTKFDYANNPDLNHVETGPALATGVGFQFWRLEGSLRPTFNLVASGFDIYYIDFRLAYVFMRGKQNR